MAIVRLPVATRGRDTGVAAVGNVSWLGARGGGTMKRGLLALALVVALWVPGRVWAAGAHDMHCTDCHSTHYAKGDYIVGVTPKQGAINPARTRTAEGAASVDVLCLGCHNEDQGIMPIDLATTHPTGVKPTYAPVPQRLLWDGVFTCVSCHNPHPSNENYKYLIVPTAQGKEMGVFCVQCHPQQSSKELVAKGQSSTITVDPALPPIVRVPAPKAPAAKAKP